ENGTLPVRGPASRMGLRMATSVERAPLVTYLPDIRTSLIGRERDADALRDLLSTGHRLVTVTGPGGVGKTRLSIHLAQQLEAAFDDAVVFVPLASVRDPLLLLPQIGSAVGFAGDPFDEYEQQLFSYLDGQRALIVLDNLEQVLDAAPMLARLRD